MKLNINKDNLAKVKNIRGECISKVITQESENFYQCSHCGQFVDMRSLYEVLYHEQKEHTRLQEQ